MNHCFSVVPEKIPKLVSTAEWETRRALFRNREVGHWVGIFLSQLNTNDEFYFSQMAIPACGKNKKRIAVHRQHASRTSIRDVIVTLK